MADERRLIDANEMKNNIMNAMMRQFEKNGDQIALRIAEMMCHFVDVTDTVDAVEVVRCGECRFVDTDACPMSGTPGRVSASDFCSYGERRAEDGH